MCIYVHICIHTYRHVDILLDIYRDTRTCMYTHICIYIHIHIHIATQIDRSSEMDGLNRINRLISLYIYIDRLYIDWQIYGWTNTCMCNRYTYMYTYIYIMLYV